VRLRDFNGFDWRGDSIADPRGCAFVSSAVERALRPPTCVGGSYSAGGRTARRNPVDPQRPLFGCFPPECRRLLPPLAMTAALRRFPPSALPPLRHTGGDSFASVARRRFQEQNCPAAVIGPTSGVLRSPNRQARDYREHPTTAHGLLTTISGIRGRARRDPAITLPEWAAGLGRTPASDRRSINDQRQRRASRTTHTTKPFADRRQMT
jgi:hypothetical protein